LQFLRVRTVPPTLYNRIDLPVKCREIGTGAVKWGFEGGASGTPGELGGVFGVSRLEAGERGGSGRLIAEHLPDCNLQFREFFPDDAPERRSEAVALSVQLVPGR